MWAHIHTCMPKKIQKNKIEIIDSAVKVVYLNLLLLSLVFNDPLRSIPQRGAIFMLAI